MSTILGYRFASSTPWKGEGQANRKKEVLQVNERRDSLVVSAWRNSGRLVGIGLLVVLLATVFVCGLDEALAAQKRDPLIEILIRKGILTEQEALQVEGEAKALEEERKQKVVEEIEKKGPTLPEGLKGISVGMLGYLDYSSGKSPEDGKSPEEWNTESSFNSFNVTRGYLTVKKQLMPWMGARITADVHQDSEEDWKLRLKYYYAELKPRDLGPLTGMKSEIGMGHVPWLDFEEYVNPYRCQGTMAIERAGTFNSADLGISLMGDFAGTLQDAKKKTGNSHYDGYYGGWHIGVYNGAGYHASEKNNDKVLEGRLTLRPLPDVLPGLQLSYFGIYGEGNAAADVTGEYPDYMVNLGMLSYEHPWLTLTAQYFETEGNAQGNCVDARGDALDTAGYSFFGNFKLPVFDKKLSLFGRYDHFDVDTDDEIADDAAYEMFLGGLAYDLFQGNMILLAYETTEYGRDSGGKGEKSVTNRRLGDDYKVQMVYQIKF